MPSLNLPEKPHTMDGIMRDLDAHFGSAPEGAEPGENLGPSTHRRQGNKSAEHEALLARLAQAAAIKPDYQIKSHRPVFGWATNLIKKLIHWGSRPYVDRLIELQERFNAEVIATLQAVAAHQTEQNIRLTAHDDRLMTHDDRLMTHDDRLRAHDGRAETLGVEIKRAHGLLDELFSRYDVGNFFEDVPREKRLELMDRFRGTFDEIWGRHHLYLDDLRDRPGKILDLGCGRGEFLHMLRHEGIESWGCEIDPLMLELARDRDLSVIDGDALSILSTVEDASLGGVFASQVVEHLFPGELLNLIKVARQKIAPGGVLILETLNPKSLAVLAKSYYKDLDHKQAIDPDYLAALVELVGFTNVEARLTMPFTDSDALAPLPPASELGIDESARAAIDSKFERISSAVWGFQDYHVIGEVTGEASDDPESGVEPSDAASSSDETGPLKIGEV